MVDADILRRLELERLKSASALDAEAALRAEGLITVASDDLDWEDEIRLAIEERTSLSPDALTGLEASLRFRGSRDPGDQGVRPPLGLAELGFPSAQRDRPRRRAETVFGSGSRNRSSIGSASDHVDRLPGTDSQ